MSVRWFGAEKWFFKLEQVPGGVHPEYNSALGSITRCFHGLSISARIHCILGYSKAKGCVEEAPRQVLLGEQQTPCLWLVVRHLPNPRGLSLPGHSEARSLCSDLPFVNSHILVAAFKRYNSQTKTRHRAFCGHFGPITRKLSPWPFGTWNLLLLLPDITLNTLSLPPGRQQRSHYCRPAPC